MYFEQRLSEHLDKAAGQFSGAENSLEVQFYSLFLLIGADESVSRTMQRKAESLLRDSRTCGFVEIPDADSFDLAAVQTSVNERTAELLRNASESHVSVKTLSEVFVSPVVFANANASRHLSEIILGAQRYFRSTALTVYWQPFLVAEIETRDYPKIYHSINAVTALLRDLGDSGSEGHTTGFCNCCCMLSNRDTQNLAVPMEQLLNTVVVVSLLQTATDALKGINLRYYSDAAQDKPFFTARNISVSIPHRCLFLDRASENLSRFSETTNQEGTLPRMNFTFLPKLLRPYFAKLPQEAGCISLLPLMSLMPDKRAMDSFVHSYYISILQNPAAQQAQLKTLCEEFLREFFARDGSLDELSELFEPGSALRDAFNKYANKTILQGIDFPSADLLPSNPANPNAKDYAFQVLQWLQNYPRQLIAQFSSDDPSGGQHQKVALKQSIDKLRHMLQEMSAVLKQQKNALSTVELYLDSAAGTGVRNAYYDDASIHGNNDFDRCICEMLLSGQDERAKLLDICAVGGGTNFTSGKKYLDSLDAVCSDETRLHALLQRVQGQWEYPLRFSANAANNNSSSGDTCVLGNSTRPFFKALVDFLRNHNVQTQQLQSPTDDRMEILHLSPSFALSSFDLWPSIRQLAEEDKS